MKPSMDDIEADILADLSELDDRMLQHAYLLECGRILPEFPDELRIDRNLIRECQARTWVAAVDDGKGARILLGDSDSLLVRGALALIKEMCDERAPDEIRACSWRLFDDDLFSRNYTSAQMRGLRGIPQRIMGATS